jgi:hypothetical protein
MSKDLAATQDDSRALAALRAAVEELLYAYSPNDDPIDSEGQYEEREHHQSRIAEILARHPEWEPAWQDDAVCL